MTWRDRVNSGLSRVTGYKLVRGDAVSTVRVEKEETAARGLVAAATKAEAVLAELDKRLKNALAAEARLAKAKEAGRPRGELKPYTFPDDFSADDKEIMNRVRQYTMTSPDKLHALITATRYVADNKIPGAIVECGVWRGGSMHAVAHTLHRCGDRTRELYLFDTYEGMTEPTDRDMGMKGGLASEALAKADKSAMVWAVAGLDDVKQGFKDHVDYPNEKVHFVVGPVEDTVPDEAPERIALLRLDTDWYESTKHELEHLWDRLVPGGVMIIDDYGTWQGSKDATDEWLATNDQPLLMLRAGRGRVILKPHTA